MAYDPRCSRATLTLDLGAIRRNYRRIREHCDPLRVMGILKANAYGLGVRPIAEALALEGIACFGVAEPAEAFAVCDLGPRVLILGGVLPHELPATINRGIMLPITSVESARQISAEATRQHRIAIGHVLVDTGMGRLGFPLREAYEAITSIATLPNLQLEGLYSHFPAAYTDQEFSRKQIRDLIFLSNELQSRAGVVFRELHISNSDGIHNVEEATQAPFTMVRSGINLYGYFDLEGQRAFDLEQGLRIESRLLAVRTLPAGSTVGYGRTHTLQQDTLVGTVAIGYADGLPLDFTQAGHLIVRGQPCPIIGRTSMDYTTIDLRAVPDAAPGDWVTCLGDSITVHDWALARDTIPYEVICSIGSRVHRHTIDTEADPHSRGSGA
jgi:alanine racemase